MSESVPTSIMIVGGGPIGVEFACLLSAFGTEVTLVEYLPQLLPAEDEDVSAELTKQLKARGIRVLTGAVLESVVDHSDVVTASVSDDHDATEIRVEKALISVGFAPRTSNLGLEQAGVSIDEGGRIGIDQFMRTSAERVWAIGDVTGKLPLAHVAEMQGVVAAESIAGVETVSVTDYRMMPRAVFGSPQVASFGLTETQARESGKAVTASTFPLVANAKAHALGEPAGFVKIVAEPDNGLLLGAHLVGPDVAELLPELTLAQLYELTTSEVVRNVHIHPTVSEAIVEAAHGILGQPVNL